MSERTRCTRQSAPMLTAEVTITFTLGNSYQSQQLFSSRDQAIKDYFATPVRLGTHLQATNIVVQAPTLTATDVEDFMRRFVDETGRIVPVGGFQHSVCITADLYPTPCALSVWADAADVKAVLEIGRATQVDPEALNAAQPLGPDVLVHDVTVSSIEAIASKASRNVLAVGV